MKNNTTELVFILDKSGSMCGMEGDTVGGFNSTIAKQRKLDGKVYVSTVLFSNDSKVLHDRVDIREITPMREEDFLVGGCTALLDAIGSNIDHIKMVHHYARPEDRPTKTLFVIMTDGLENASRHFSDAQIRSLIREQEQNAGWEFMFIGADIDVFASADDVGIKRSHSFEMSKSTDSFAGCLDAVGDVMNCVAERPDKLGSEDWDALQRIFSKKRRR